MARPLEFTNNDFGKARQRLSALPLDDRVVLALCLAEKRIVSLKTALAALEVPRATGYRHIHVLLMEDRKDNI